MAEASWPDPADGRVVSEWQYEQLAARFSDDGLDGTVFSGAPVVAGSGMQVLVRAGQRASVRGFAWESGEDDVPLAIASNASGSTRQDWVVLRLDRSDWRVRAAIRQGSPGSGPPSLVQQPGPTGVYEIPLARVRVTSGASSIVGSDVTPWPLYVGSRVRPGGDGRNPNPQPGEIAWVSGRTYDGWDGVAWRTLLEDTGWVVLAPANLNNWSNHGIRARRLNGVVYYEVNVRREGSTLSTSTADNAEGSHLFTLPAGMRPSVVMAQAVTLSGGISARLRIYPNGEVYLQVPTATVGVGRFARNAGSFPV